MKAKMYDYVCLGPGLTNFDDFFCGFSWYPKLIHKLFFRLRKEEIFILAAIPYHYEITYELYVFMLLTEKQKKHVELPRPNNESSAIAYQSKSKPWTCGERKAKQDID